MRGEGVEVRVRSWGEGSELGLAAHPPHPPRRQRRRRRARACLVRARARARARVRGRARVGVRARVQVRVRVGVWARVRGSASMRSLRRAKKGASCSVGWGRHGGHLQPTSIPAARPAWLLGLGLRLG